MTEPSWVEHAIWWHVYPLGFVGAYPSDDPPRPHEHRLRRLVEWFDHAIALGASGIALGPIFSSRTHGYDTTDHFRIDPRLGDDDDFDHLVTEARRRGLRVLLDGVFNHVGADFPMHLRAAHDETAARWFRGRPGRFDVFEGNDGLLTLNHDNPEVVEYTVEAMNHWLDRGADGWRLDAAHAVPQHFWASVLPKVRASHPDAWLVGELMGGDHAAVVHDTGLDSATQYDLWKAIWSGLNNGNLFELDEALLRHNELQRVFAPLTFIGNHDVTRIASQIQRPEHLAHALVILLTTGGVPSIYAGDEMRYEGVKGGAAGDDELRPEFGCPRAPLSREASETWSLYQHLVGLRRRHPWLHAASTSALRLTASQYVYRTEHGEQSLIVALSTDDEPMHLEVGRVEVIAGSGAPPTEIVGSVVVEPHGWRILRPC